MKLLASIASLLFAVVSAAHADTVTPPAAPGGASLEIIAEFPAGPGPFPAVVLAPGQGYHMALPVLTETAHKLVERGVAVFRFNWAYFSKSPAAGEPSADLSVEVQNLDAVVAAARADRRVDSSRLFVGGKSLGSLVAWQVLRHDAGLRGALLLTPICTDEQDGKTLEVGANSYPGLLAERRPLAFIAGDLDPNCAATTLYAFAATAKGNVRVAVVGGDHSFHHPSLAAEQRGAAAARSIGSVAQLSADFVQDSLER